MARAWILLVATLLAGCAAAAPPPPPSTPSPAAAASSPSEQQARMPPPAPSLRLPPVARPLRYDLDLWLDPDAREFRGRIAIDLEVLAATRTLWLDATDLTIDAASLEGDAAPARVVPGGDDFVGFVFDRELAPGKARLTVSYRGRIDPERSRGIYSAREGQGDGETRAYLYTFFEPTDARRAFPCFDEPAYKVPWKVSLHVPAGDVALGNAPAVAERTDEGGGKLVELAESQPLPSYLVAFVVGPFDVIDAGVAGRHGTPLRFVVPRGRGAATAYAASVTPKIVGLLEDYFGMPYPYEKLDVAVVPRYWGTMEHPGLVALGQPLTLIDPADRSVQREQLYTWIASHELSHYWFGDYVTMRWWDDMWLNESLGTWLDAKITAGVDPSWGFDLERLDRAQTGMRGDALASAKRIRQPVDSKSDIEAAADSEITYYKGQSVVGMFEAWMTPERFQHAMRAYVAAHAWGSATAEDFFAALDAEQPGAGQAFRTFVDQPGVPSIRVRPVCKGDSRAIEVRQQRYEPLGAHLDPETWRVPVCVRYPASRTTWARACTLLDSESATIPIDAAACPAWVVGNADARGYYHVAYAPDALRAVLAAGSGISLAERASALGDAVALVESGDLPLTGALALVPDSAGRGERHVVSAGLRLARLVSEAAMSDAEAARAARFFDRVYGPPARALGLVRRPDDGVDAALLRPELLWTAAVRGQDAALRAKARDLASAWLRDPNAVAPELVDPVLAAAAGTNDAALFAALLDRARAEKDHRKAAQLLSALGAFTAPDLARRAQDLVDSPAFDVRDAIGVLRTQFQSRATRDAAWDFVKARFDAFSQRMRSDEVGFEVVALARTFCDDAHAADVKAFFAPRAERYDGMPHSVATAVDAVSECAAAFRRNQPSLDAFLARY